MVVNPKSASAALTEQILDMLIAEWPAQTRESRIESLNACSGAADSLPATLILVQQSSPDSKDNSPTVLAHSQLQVAADHTDGSAAIVYSVVVHKQHRRKGLGRVLMDFTERVARE